MTDARKAAEQAVIEAARKVRTYIHGGSTVLISERRLEVLTDALIRLDAARSSPPESGEAETTMTSALVSQIQHQVDRRVEWNFDALWARFDERCRKMDARIAALESSSLRVTGEPAPGSFYTKHNPLTCKHDGWMDRRANESRCGMCGATIAVWAVGAGGGVPSAKGETTTAAPASAGETAEDPFEERCRRVLKIGRDARDANAYQSLLAVMAEIRSAERAAAASARERAIRECIDAAGLAISKEKPVLMTLHALLSPSAPASGGEERKS